MSLKTQCLLCQGPAGIFEEIAQKGYFACQNCGAVFLDSRFHVSTQEEKARYETHNNDVDDPGYQRFVQPVIDAVEQSFSPDCRGLDFGAGTGPVITKILREKGYAVEVYDPFFANHPEALEQKYDFIVCCEVIEHFRDPAKEFGLLRSLLNPRGALFCMTEVYSEGIDFRSWYYKNDPTHIFFYQHKTCEWIRDQYQFSSLERQGRLIQLFT